jgi:hypothetical protein
MILDLFRKEIGFENIQGYDDLKDIVRRALDAEDNYNLLFIGPPASAKTLFLLGTIEYKKGVYFDGSNTTNRILDVLEGNTRSSTKTIFIPNGSSSYAIDSLKPSIANFVLT